MAMAGCGEQKIVVHAQSLICTQIDRYHTTDAEREAAAANWSLWKGIFTYLAKVAKTRDDECLQPGKGL